MMGEFISYNLAHKKTHQVVNVYIGLTKCTEDLSQRGGFFIYLCSFRFPPFYPRDHGPGESLSVTEGSACCVP